jgi:hypothetical protein
VEQVERVTHPIAGIFNRESAGPVSRRPGLAQRGPFGRQPMGNGTPCRGKGIEPQEIPARAVRPQPKWDRETAMGARIDAKKTHIRVCLDLVLSYPRSSAQSAVNFGRPIVTTADYADERG